MDEKVIHAENAFEKPSSKDAAKVSFILGIGVQAIIFVGTYSLAKQAVMRHIKPMGLARLGVVPVAMTVACKVSDALPFAKSSLEIWKKEERGETDGGETVTEVSETESDD